MIFKFWLFCFVLIKVSVTIESGEEKIVLTGKKDIAYEKGNKSKAYKSSSKPSFVIKQPQYEITVTTQLLNENTGQDLTEKSVPKRRKNAVSEESRHFLVCPQKNIPKFPFALPCFVSANCGLLGKDMLCCDGRCSKGVGLPEAEVPHEPILFGIIERSCPKDPLTEISEIKECIIDDDCSPRICCGETLPNGKKVRYCRTPMPVWDTLPLPSQLLEPLKSLTSYMQCTPPPPAHLDLHPKACQNPLDCFPNLCCQEKGKRFCRPPVRSLLSLVAQLGQRIIPEDAARKFIERIS